jgi:Exostosin family
MVQDSETMLLDECLSQNQRNLLTRQGLTAFPHFWQVPAATEKAAYEALIAQSRVPDFDYLAFPWATLIDGLRNNATPTWELMRILNSICTKQDNIGTSRRATVAQHIHADKFIAFFQACGVTDLFWPHATTDRQEIGGITIHPFLLFPAQTPNGAEPGDLRRPRRHLANFIGAYNPHIYLTDVREHIFRDAGNIADLLIIKREAWHFDRAVYSQQMKGISPDKARLELEDQHKAEYLQAIRDSAFTLCPSGSGPNSIRIGEALALGSIPIILTRTLALPGPRDLWEKACLIEDDSAQGYRRALVQARSMAAAELEERQKATQELFARIGPEMYGCIIEQSLAAADSRTR